MVSRTEVKLEVYARKVRSNKDEPKQPSTKHKSNNGRNSYIPDAVELCGKYLDMK